MRFGLGLLAFVLLVFVAPSVFADDCDTAIRDAHLECKAITGQSMQTAAEKVRSIVQKHRAEGRSLASSKTAKMEYAEVAAKQLRSAAGQCRGLIPKCTKVCGSADPCLDEISRLTVQIEAAANDSLLRASQ